MSGPLLFDLTPNGSAWDLATSLCLISILLAGIALGVGKAFGSRKLWAWGAEEFTQAILNAALLGALILFTAALSGAMSEALPASASHMTCASAPHDAHAAMNLSLCSLEQTSNDTQNITLALMGQSYKLGLLSGLSMDVNVIHATPYQALAWPAKTFADWAANLSGWQALAQTQMQFLGMVGSQGFALFLQAGLLLRLFFPTRKLGGAVMAGVIAFFIIYPLTYGLLVWEGPLPASHEALAGALDENAKALAVVPALDWSKPAVIADLMQGLDGQDLAARTAGLYSPMGNFFGVLSLYLMVYPLIALMAALVAGIGLAGILGAEMRMDLFSMA